MTTLRHGRRAAIVLALAATTMANPMHAQPPGRPAAGRASATPLADSARAIAAARSHELTAAVADGPPVQGPRRGMPCGVRVVLGALVGAAAGALTGVAILAKTGGSDSTGAVLRGFAVLGAGFGTLGGGLSCLS